MPLFLMMLKIKAPQNLILELQMKLLQKLTYINESNIHGKGLFAQTDIPKDTIIGTLQGRHCDQDGSYVLWLSETDGFEVSCDLKYINHSQKANACYYDDLTVVALRHIEQHEEITHNYETADW
jgi:SET domain-containing protein